MEKREFARRRKRLMDVVDSGGIVIQPNAPERVRNRDVYYPYRSDSDFFYLSGFSEPESVMVLVPERPQGEVFAVLSRARRRGGDLARAARGSGRGVRALWRRRRVSDR